MKYLIFLFTFLYVFEGFSLDLEEAIKKYTGRGTQLAGEAGNICAIQSPQTSDATELAKYYCNDKGLMHYEVDPFFYPVSISDCSGNIYTCFSQNPSNGSNTGTVNDSDNDQANLFLTLCQNTFNDEKKCDDLKVECYGVEFNSCSAVQEAKLRETATPPVAKEPPPPADTPPPEEPPGGNTPPPGSGSNPYDVARADKDIFEPQIEVQCKDMREDAEYCCGPTAMGCLIGAPKDSDIGAITSVGTMLAQALIANRQLTSMAENCDSQAGLANFGAGINTAMATQCHMKRSTCDNSCTT
ncbi:MAG: hypothetical protein KDD58_02555 [Bdellovibrionales bacterium]|nr:hypothetical protein [Bdellovibrionales bacterium]